jgi:hypothetical protein
MGCADARRCIEGYAVVVVRKAASRRRQYQSEFARCADA